MIKEWRCQTLFQCSPVKCFALREVLSLENTALAAVEEGCIIEALCDCSCDPPHT